MSTNLKYGVNITESDVQNMLEQNQKQQNGVKTWRTLLGGAGIGYNTGRDAALSSFSDTVAQAYDASLANKNAIYASGLNAGATKNLLRDNASSLHQAYESALSNYNKNLATVTDAYQKETGTIVTDLQNEAKNYTELLNKSYDYLKELYGANQTIPGTAENGAAEKYEGSGKNTEFKGYEDVNLNYLQDNNLAWTLDESGALKSWEDIQAEMFDDDGNLNARGVEFFDAVYNADPQEYMVTNAETNETSKLRSFDEYLSDVSPELRNWYVSSDQYNATRAGTKRGSLNVLTGRESDDFLYNKNDYRVYSTDKLNQIGAEFGATGELAGKAAKANDEFNYYKESGVDATYDYTALENEVAQAKAKIDELSKKSTGGAADSAAIQHAYAVYKDAQNRLDEAKGSPEYIQKYTATGAAGRKAENDANRQRAEAKTLADNKIKGAEAMYAKAQSGIAELETELSAAAENYETALRNRQYVRDRKANEAVDKAYAVYKDTQRRYKDAKALAYVNYEATVNSAKTALAKTNNDIDTKLKTTLGEFNTRYNTAKTSANDTWTSYKKSFYGSDVKISDYLKEELGAGASDEFWSKNKDLKKEYDALYKKLENAGSYDKKLVSYADSFYKKLLQRADQYVQNKSYKVGRHSGY